MPTYEFKCRDCGKEFLLSLTLRDRETGGASCPDCKSKRVEQLFTGVQAKTSRKS